MAVGHRAAVNVVVRYAPDLQRQVQALLHLLGHTGPGPETQPPQHHVGAGASSVAIVASDRKLRSGYDECSTDSHDNQ